MNALTVRGKLVVAFSCMSLLMTALGGFALLQPARVHRQGESIRVFRLPGVPDSMRIQAAAGSTP